MRSCLSGTAFFRAFMAFSWLILAIKAPQVSAQQRQVGVQTGIDEGGLILGAHFDMIDTSSENYGIYTRLYSKDEDKGAPALFALGGSFRGHFKHGIFDYYISPGFGILHYSLRRTHLLLGPSLAYGLTADFDKTMAVGIENTKLYSWVGDVRGLVKDSFLLNFRFNLP